MVGALLFLYKEVCNFARRYVTSFSVTIYHFHPLIFFSSMAHSFLIYADSFAGMARREVVKCHNQRKLD